MTPERQAELERVAQAISDGTRVDWERERTSRPELSAVLSGLGMIERVRDAHGGAAATGIGSEPSLEESTDSVADAAPPSPQVASAAAPLFTWGPLRVLEQVGEGAAGSVFRAFDPTLQTEVALKLRKKGAEWLGTDAKRFLSEARRLARVRHPNVLSVRGADVHDGRMGIWTDFVVGRSLEDQVRHQGSLSAREAALIGLDLCRALAAVHAQGLLHRDVKASNVMREQGGRILLMDFGSVAELPSLGGPTDTTGAQGTPLYMAPEQLHGRLAGAATDIYALGVLLYRLVTGRYPVEAASMDELRERHARGERVPLRDRRADLPLDFVQVVERTLAVDPRDRFPSVGLLERALAATISAPEPLPPRPRRAMALAGIAVAVAAVAWFVTHLPDRHPEPTPAAVARTEEVRPAGPLRAEASLIRRTAEGDQVLAENQRVAPGDLLAMSLESREPMNVYVLNEDSQGGVVLLFPLPGLTPRNPISASVRYRLPGQAGDSLVYWKITSAGERESIVAIGTRTPFPELEEIIAKVPPAAPGKQVEYPEITPSLLGRLRGIGGIVKEGTISEGERVRLNEAIQSLDERRKEKGDVWLWKMTLRNPAR